MNKAASPNKAVILLSIAHHSLAGGPLYSVIGKMTPLISLIIFQHLLDLHKIPGTWYCCISLKGVRELELGAAAGDGALQGGSAHRPGRHQELHRQPGGHFDHGPQHVEHERHDGRVFSCGEALTVLSFLFFLLLIFSFCWNFHHSRTSRGHLRRPYSPSCLLPSPHCLRPAAAAAVAVAVAVAAITPRQGCPRRKFAGA